MLELSLTLESKDASLEVRRFAVHEHVGRPFEVSVWAASRNDDLDLETLVGHAAALSVGTGLTGMLSGSRRWTGLCRKAEHVSVESDGSSVYFLQIVPTLWLLGQRTSHRLFQHASVPDIVDVVLREWKIEPIWRIDRAAYPRLELRAQYGESDLAFLDRLLEDAGITTFFDDDPSTGTRLVLADAPQTRGARAGALPYIDKPNRAAQIEHVTDVEITRSARTGKIALRDHDFRRRPDMTLTGSSPPVVPAGFEDRFERFDYRPGLSLIEIDARKVGALDARAGTRPVGRRAPTAGSAAIGGVVGAIAARSGGGDAAGIAARIAGDVASGKDSDDRLAGDDQSVTRHIDAHAELRAQRELESRRAVVHEIRFATNAFDLAPGVVLAIAGHPREALARRLLIVENTVEGTAQGDAHQHVRAVFADAPYRPERRTQRPVVHGIQSAVVVGPPGQEIHVDEHGRVRVQFPWDREGKLDDRGSCWLRVSQGWAGAGYGLFTVPRVGNEVWVAFADGDPDMPMIVGRVHGGTTPPPATLPKQATRSMRVSRTSPGGEGANELTFEDQKGEEVVLLRAQKDLQHVVQDDRGAVIGKVDTTVVGARQLTRMARSGTGFEMVKDRITLTAGGATVVLDGANITIWAKGTIAFHASGGSVDVQGGPAVKLNSGASSAAPGGLPSGGSAPKPSAAKPSTAKPTSRKAAPAQGRVSRSEVRARKQEAAARTTGPGGHGKLESGRRYVVYDDEVRVGGTRSWRNNNPGNMEHGEFAMNHGAIGSDGRFAVFPDHATGRDALHDLLRTDRYGDRTVAQTMQAYAPSHENNTAAYIDAVTHQTGIDASRTMSTLDEHELSSFMDAIEHHEGMRAGTIYEAGSPDLPREIAPLLGGR